MTQASGLMSGDYVSDWTAMLELRKVPHYNQINNSPPGQSTWTNGSLIKFLWNVSLLFQIVSVNNEAREQYPSTLCGTTQTAGAIWVSLGLRKYVSGKNSSLGNLLASVWFMRLAGFIARIV